MSGIEQELITHASKEGIFALLFVLMLLYVMWEKRQADKRNEAREACLKRLLTELADRYSAINDVCKTLERIEKKLK